MTRWTFGGVWIAVLVLAFSGWMHADEGPSPGSVAELWGDVDPRREPLETQVVREWQRDGIVYRYVTFRIGEFKGRPARMAAFYAFPAGGRELPGLLHLHGGGQRAFLHEVDFYARRGYAALSINWGGREMEEARPDDPNTDWGAVDPTQQNVPGYFNLQPGELYLDPFESPRNNNWYLLTLGGRRGLTFLERQAEVDPQRLGIYGHSMGGNLTVYVAGTDDRVKVAAPSVGGQGFRTFPWELLPAQRKLMPRGDVDLFRATIGLHSYASRIECPVLWLGATNDFHGIMDDTYRSGDLIPHDNVRYAFTPHMNHRFTPPFAVTRPLWIDQHLQGTFRFPETPATRLNLATSTHVPELHVTPDRTRAVQDVHVLYSFDPDPQARFWRTAAARMQGDAWIAELPILSPEQPLFAYANVHYELDAPCDYPQGTPTDTLAISSRLHTATPPELQAAGVVATDEPSRLIDDFAQGWQDWYTLSANNPHHWEFSTRKLNDPKWLGRDDEQLVCDVQSDQPNEMVLVLTENFFRPYRGRQQAYVAVVELQGGAGVQRVTLSPGDFRSDRDGTPLENWRQIDLLSLRANHESERSLYGSKSWAGPQPQFSSLRWERTAAR